MKLTHQQVADVLGVTSATLHARRKKDRDSGSRGEIAPRGRKRSLNSAMSQIEYDSDEVTRYIGWRLEQDTRRAREASKRLAQIMKGPTS